MWVNVVEHGLLGKFYMKLKAYLVSHFVVYMAFSHGVYTGF